MTTFFFFLANRTANRKHASPGQSQRNAQDCYLAQSVANIDNYYFIIEIHDSFSEFDAITDWLVISMEKEDITLMHRITKESVVIHRLHHKLFSFKHYRMFFFFFSPPVKHNDSACSQIFLQRWHSAGLAL